MLIRHSVFAFLLYYYSLVFSGPGLVVGLGLVAQGRWWWWPRRFCASSCFSIIICFGAFVVAWANFKHLFELSTNHEVVTSYVFLHISTPSLRKIIVAQRELVGKHKSYSKIHLTQILALISTSLHRIRLFIKF